MLKWYIKCIQVDYKNMLLDHTVGKHLINNKIF